MAQNQLQEFFHNKKQKAKPADIDWTAKRDHWIQAVKDLYHTIEEEYLKAAKDDVDVKRQNKEVKEDFIGEYQVPELILRVGNEQVVFSPKGTNILGAKGRIDVQGERGEANIVWQDGNHWSIVVSRVPKPQLVPLTADSLESMLREIMRP
jgi:hypothetical protein